MKLVCNGLDLINSVSKVVKAVSGRTTNPILECIMLCAEGDTLTLTGTDTDLTIVNRIRADVDMDGTAVINGKFFADYTRKMSEGPIELTLFEGVLKIRYQDSSGDIRCLNADEYPRVAQGDDSVNFSLKQESFKDMIGKIAFSVAVDDARPILKGVLLEVQDGTLTGVALDGYRLAKCSKALGGATANMSVIVPSRSLNELHRLLSDCEDEAVVYFRRNQLKIDLGDTHIYTRLLDGEYINYKQLLPTDFFTEVTVSKKHFEDSLERASLLSRVDKHNQVKLDIKDNIMNIYSESELASIAEKLAVKLTGKDIYIAFNVKYFNDALKAVDDEFVKIKFNKPESPCVISPVDGGGYLYLVLPIRIRN